jgi:hypothetical protein
MLVFGQGLRRATLAAAVIGYCGTFNPAGAQTAAPAAPTARIGAALQNITTLVRPGQVGYATFWDGNKYVQCRRTPERALRCEAAGASMQPSLKPVLTGKRLSRLVALGWALDPSFGNYVQTFAADLSTARVADRIWQVLTEAYGANEADFEFSTAWVKDVPCPPRNGYTQNLAGSVNDAPSMRPTAIRGCFYKPPNDASQIARSAAELISIYGPRITAEVQRLRINVTRHVYVVFDAGIGYVQCMPETPNPVFYCEAQSAESWAALAAILTPERVAKLHAAGYADPGRAPNYWKSYPFDKFSDAAIATEILTLLHEVYGYTGAEKLEIMTER